MKNLYIYLLAMCLASLSSFAKDYSPAEIEAILKENATLKSENAEYVELATQAVTALRDNLNIKTALKKTGLAIDAKTAKVKLSNPDVFMSAFNVVIFTQEEFEALSKNPPKAPVEVPAKNVETDFRDAVKGDYKEKSNNFWKNVIY